MKRVIRDIEEEVVKDFASGMLSRDMEKKYEYTWATLRKIIIKKGIPLRPMGGSRDRAGRKSGIKNMWGG